MGLDSLDRQLLNLVQADAKQTTERLAGQIALSPSAIRRRLRRLREEGVIVRDSAMEQKRAGRAAKVDVDALQRSDWIAAAKAVLVRDGAAAVKVERIATSLNVTRGGFYWRFRDHADLMDALLKDWRETNSATLLEVLRGPGAPLARLWALARVWIDEIGYDPNYDTAVRAWATISKKVARVVRAVDDDRIEAINNAFVEYGCDNVEATIRARVLYYHQVGYYAMGVKEPKSRRHDLSAHYFRILTGLTEWPAGR